MKKLLAVLLVLCFALALPGGAFAASGQDGADIRFLIEGNATNPGEAVVIRGVNIPGDAVIETDSDIPFKPLFFREPARVAAKNGDMVAFLPVSYYTEPGEHYITLACGEAWQTFRITAADKKFSVQHLTVPQETAEQTILSREADAEYEKYIAPVRGMSDPEQHWSGRFIWPVKGSPRVTTLFGAFRYVNGGKTPSRHGALDFAAPAGTPVYASGAGNIAFAGYLQLTGYTVVIEHGYGLKTWYYHMNGLNVKTGDQVEQGRQIGKVGSTGFSTGAHLHFGMSVSNANGHVFINPETAVHTGLFDDMAREAADFPQD